MVRARPGYGHTSLVKPFLAITLVAAAVALVLVYDVPARLAGLGSGQLERMTAPTTTRPFGTPVRLDGRSTRPAIVVRAGRPVPTVSVTRRVRPGPGHRLWAVPVTIRNDGAIRFVSARTGASTMSVVAETASGDDLGPDPRVRRVRSHRVLPAVVRLRPGASASGVLVFDLPRATTIRAVRLTVGSGLTRTAEWVVPRG